MRDSARADHLEHDQGHVQVDYEMKRLAIIGLLLLVPQLTSARTWYIKPDSTGGAPTIKAGLDSASSIDPAPRPRSIRCIRNGAPRHYRYNLYHDRKLAWCLLSTKFGVIGHGWARGSVSLSAGCPKNGCNSRSRVQVEFGGQMPGGKILPLGIFLGSSFANILLKKQARTE